MITGGLGFIGSNLAKRLVDLGGQVTVVDSLVPEYGGNLYNVDGFRDRLRINISDVRDRHIQALNYRRPSPGRPNRPHVSPDSTQ